MKKIYIFAAVLALLTLSLNAQDGKLKTATSMRLQTSSQTVKDPKAQPPTMNELLRGIKGMSSVLQATQGPNASANQGANRAPLKLNAREELMGPFTTYDTSVSGYTSYGWSTAYGSNYQQIYVFADLDRSAFEGHDGEEIVGYRFALAGNTSQTAVLYDFMAWPYSTNSYFEAANRHTWSISESAGAQPINSFDNIVITVPSYYTMFRSITVYGDNNAVLTSWNADESLVTDGTNDFYQMPDGWENTSGGGYMFQMPINNVNYGYLSSASQSVLTIDGSLLNGQSSVSVVIQAICYDGTSTVDVNGDTRNLTTTQSTNTWNFSPTGTTTPVYQELQAGQWYEYYLDEPIPFNVADSIQGMYLGYRFFQYPSTETNELLNPVAINPNSNTAGIVTYRTGDNGLTYVYDDVTITLPSTYTNIRSITISSGGTTITSYSYANNGNTLPEGWSMGGTIGLRNDYSSQVSIYSSDGTGSIIISGDLLEGHNSVTVSIYFSTSTRNQTATVGVNGTNKTTTNRTGSTQTWTLNGTYTNAYSTGWWDENIAGDLAVQLIFKSSKNPTIEVSPATQTINDAAAGTVTVTGTDIDGNINVSAADNDWTVNPTSLTGTGGNVNVTYTGRDLSASTTVTATAADDNTVTASATVDYVADVYIVGNYGSGWDFANGTSMTNANGTYTATLTVDAGSYILFARLLGNSNPWNTRDVFGPDSNGDWWMQGNSASGNIDLNDDDPIYFQEGGTYRITINANDGTFTITKLHGEQTAAPTITYSVSSDGEHVTITATGNGTVTLNVPGCDPVSGNGSASITVPCGYVSNTITVTATAQEDGKDESDPATAQVNIPAGTDWVEMDGTYDNPNDLLSFLKGGEDIMMLDQFTESTLNNDHPAGYTYTLREIQNGESKISTPVPIPVYKTNSSMDGFYTYNEIIADTDMHLKAGVVNAKMNYDVKPDGNTLYYSLYRDRKVADPAVQQPYPVIDAPYRVSQLQGFEENTQYFMFESHPVGVAPRYDHVGNEIVERLDANYVQVGAGQEMSYVPVIWTLGINTARGDGKDNTYGSDIKTEKLGGVEATYDVYYTTTPNGMFKVGNVDYCICHPEIKITGTLPATKVVYNDGDEAVYTPFMYRAWCTYPGAYNFTKDEEGHLVAVGPLITSESPAYLLQTEFDDVRTEVSLGGDVAPGNDKVQWAFGVPANGLNAQELTFVVRFYYKKTTSEVAPNGLRNQRAEGDDDHAYYIVETRGSADRIITAVNELYGAGVEPVSVTYVNAQGMQSSKPFDGINIVVTRYSDGSTTTSKIVR